VTKGKLVLASGGVELPQLATVVNHFLPLILQEKRQEPVTVDAIGE
jgi:hypothetical protein